jgi:hypothetical protein
VALVARGNGIMTHAVRDIAVTVPAGAVFKNDVSEEARVMLALRRGITRCKISRHVFSHARTHVSSAGLEAEALVKPARVVHCRKG